MTTDCKNVANSARNQSDLARRSLEQHTREFARMRETAIEAAKVGDVVVRTFVEWFVEAVRR